MTDWLSSMSQEFEYYTVDPGTWKDVRKLNEVTSSTINRDLSNDTLGSATIDMTEYIGEEYVRIYLVTVQNGIRERYPLGTFLVQTPSFSFDGKVSSYSLDAYTPLLELSENPPALGYSLNEGDNIMDRAYLICRDHARAPVVKAVSEDTLYSDFVSNTNDTWLTFVKDLIANANFEFGLDETGRILFNPKQDVSSLQAVWTYDDSNSSILYPEVSIDQDVYGIPNVVEVIYSDSKRIMYATARNDNPNSIVSTVSRGREILYRDTNPTFSGTPSQKILDEYAQRLLKEQSSLNCSLSYKHGYCPVRLGDCVRLNYARANINGVRAKVISQSITCEPGCPVTEKASFKVDLLEGVMAGGAAS